VNENSKENIKREDKLGIFFLVSSLLFYFLIKFPFNFFVICSNVNEGYYFIFGQTLLDGRPFEVFRGPLFVLFYSLVLKIFGFGTYSIIAIHIFQTILCLIIGLTIFVLVKKIFSGNLYAGLSVLFWVLMQFVSIGGWGQGTMEGEIESTFALEAEYFCVLFSLLSMYFLFTAIKEKGSNLNDYIFSFIAGICAASSTMFKANGAVLGIAIVFFAIYLLFLEKKIFYLLWKHLICFIIGLFFSLLMYNFLIYFLKGDVCWFWKNYFTIGSYSTSFLSSLKSFLVHIWNIMTRYYFSISNFVLFLFAFASFLWALIRNIFIAPERKTRELAPEDLSEKQQSAGRRFIKQDSFHLKIFSPLLGIWGIGNMCAVIAPGEYASYYYILVWPSIAIAFSLVIKDLFSNFTFMRNKFVVLGMVILVTAFFLNRIFIASPSYITMLKNLHGLIFTYQPESFQDQVRFNYKKPYNDKRPSFLRVADLINSYLPNKNDKFYVFNLTSGKHLTFTPFIYIYAKRPPSTFVISDYFYYKKLSELFLDKLKRDFILDPPKIIILPNNPDLAILQRADLTPFLIWFNKFLWDKYYLKDTFQYSCTGYLCHSFEEVETWRIYERKIF